MKPLKKRCKLGLAVMLTMSVIGCSERKNSSKEESTDLSAENTEQADEKPQVTIGSDVSLFMEKFGDDRVVYSVLPPRGRQTQFRYFGFEVSPGNVIFTGDAAGIVKAVAILKHGDRGIGDRKEWGEREILDALRSFSVLPAGEWIEMDADDHSKGFRTWADMSSISTEGGNLAYYDESYRGLVIGRQSQIVKLMEDFQKSKIIDQRNIEIRKAND